jgi:hypothetical protein
MPLLCSRNKGKKNRERSDERHNKGLIMGAPFTPVGGALERRKCKEGTFSIHESPMQLHIV